SDQLTHTAFLATTEAGEEIMGAGGRARLLAACLPTVLMAGAGTVSGVLVSTQVQQQGEQQQVLGVHEVGKSRHGGGGGGGVNNNSRLRGAGS
ncbi:unnamed protein product, partial [Ectocarpus fasciculatus]